MLETKRYTELDHLIFRSATSSFIKGARPCGDCNACCSLPAIVNEPDIPDKPAGVVCAHCSVNGCGIYDRRPSVCQAYQCLWSLRLDDSDPMKTGVAWTLQLHPGGRLLLMGHCKDAIKASKNKDVRATMKRFMSESYLITAVTLRGDKHVISWLPFCDEPPKMADVDQTDKNRMRVLLETERPFNDEQEQTNQ